MSHSLFNDAIWGNRFCLEGEDTTDEARVSDSVPQADAEEANTKVHSDAKIAQQRTRDMGMIFRRWGFGGDQTNADSSVQF